MTVEGVASLEARLLLVTTDDVAWLVTVATDEEALTVTVGIEADVVPLESELDSPWSTEV